MARTSIQTRTHKGAQQGFTLIEMAIAVAIFGLLASGAIMATSAWLGKQALDKTAKNLDRIESALTLYVIQMGRLPCPYDPTAAAGTYVDTNGTAGTGCNVTATPDVYVGLLPYRDLGLQRTDVLDGWNRYITYAVDAIWTGNPADGSGGGFMNGNVPPQLYALTALSGSVMDGVNPIGADAIIDVRDSASATTPVCKDPADPAGTRTAICAAYVLVSHGEGGRGSYVSFGSQGPAAVANTAEARNTKWNIGTVLIESTPHDITFASEAFNGATTPFDHIVRFRTASQILRDAY